MLIFKRILGVMTGSLAIAYFVSSTSRASPAPYVIAGMVCVIFTVLLFKPTKKDKTETTQEMLGSTEQVAEYEKNSTNPKFHRSEQEEDLCVKFMMNHDHEIRGHTNNFEDSYKAAFNEPDPDKKIMLLEKTVSEFEKSKRWFYRTKGGTIYFQDFYEHLHNSNNNDFSYLDGVQGYLDDLIRERDYIIPQILHLLSVNGEIIQKDIYSHLPDVPRSEVQKIIRELESGEKISREKKGSSYLLKLK